MDLYLSIIADELKKRSFNVITTLFEEQPIKGIRFLSLKQTPLNHYLYFATAEQLKNTPESQWPQHLIVPEAPFSDSLPHAKLNILFLDSSESQLELFSHLQDIFADFESWYQKIQQAMINHADITAILNIASEKLDNPIALFDITNSLIHWSGSFSSDIKGSIWENALENGYTMDYFSYGEWKDLSKKMNSSNTPILSHSKGDDSRSILSCPLKNNGKFIGSLGMTSINTPFTPGQIKLVMIVKDLLETAMIHSTNSFHGSDHVPYYVESLLNGLSVDEKIISFYLNRHGWKINDSYCLLNFSFPMENILFDNFIHPYIGRIKDFFPFGICCPFDDSLIVILNITNYDNPVLSLANILEELYDRFQIQCGISSDFYHFLDLKHYFVQAKSALAEGLNQNPHQAFYYYLDYYQSNLFHKLDSITSIKSLCHPRILKIWEEGDTNQLLLLQTLHAFLLNGRNLTLTANTLTIHRNTLLYRLDKISELLKINLKDLEPDTLFYLLMSCMMIEYC
ncbi:helix-turn-helix domain-containing protein [Acetobacterium wieringae]|uniref:Helix-turn-helix domain-containing protein n=1 Tax=Acetobacterium wieringae TaxID=52694 RepID=A0ABY6HIN5_9FIRM|nr:PucR family transcriptional regulator [Acetobacterium wieringae]UYO64360.1 helix-turn-helix domain-containing protein [Acetobacterium wieringae]VUZ27137.1 Uncharacterised protein [Acetobacterium wieringae]